MKAGKGVKIVKQIVSMVTCVAKSKCTAIRTKADAVKARLMLSAFTILSRRKKFSIQSIDRDDSSITLDYCNAMVVYSADAAAIGGTGDGDGECNIDDDDKYPDLTHSLFDEEEEVIADLLEDTNASVIDQVKNSKEDKESFNLEDEIDEVADLFINKFHRRMHLQKLLSFKRYQKMMEKSA